LERITEESKIAPSKPTDRDSPKSITSFPNLDFKEERKNLILQNKEPESPKSNQSTTYPASSIPNISIPNLQKFDSREEINPIIPSTNDPESQ